MHRWLAVTLWIVAGYCAYAAVTWAFLIVKSVLSPWLGPEPELMIPLVPLALAFGLAWLGRRVWVRGDRAAGVR